MLPQKNTDKLERITNSLQSTPKFSSEFSASLNATSKDKHWTEYNENGYSPYIHSVSISPSNRIQIKIHPYIEARAKSSKKDDFYIPCNLLCAKHSGDNAIQSGGVASATSPDSLASLPNCHALKILPFSPEIDFQEYQENLLALHLDSGNFSALPDLPRAKQFTPLARRTILDAAGALEKEGYLPEHFQFFTGTLPGSSPSACEYFARYSRKFLNALKTLLGRLGLNLTFNCWEWQLRKKANLVPALHLHLVVLCQDQKLSARLPQILEDAWFRLLSLYSAESGIDLFERHQKLGGGSWTPEQLKKAEEKNNFKTCKTIQCEKSPAAYLSKYVGKGSLASDTDFQDRFKKHSVPLYYPSSWWSISKKIRDLIHSHSRSFSFLGSMERCMDAYHSLTSILEDDEYDLVSLALPVFIPSWSGSNRIYRNFYCKSQHYEACQELLSTYSGEAENTNYYSDRIEFFPSRSYLIQFKFESESSGHLMSRLIRSLPFYCLVSGQACWDNPMTIEAASNILDSDIDYPTLESLEDRISWQNHLDSLSDEQKAESFSRRFSLYA